MKKFRLLSTLLAALMVISMFTGITASAKQIDANTFFCDFENLEALSADLLIGEGFMHAASTFDDSWELADDAEYGKALQFNRGIDLYVGLNAPVTSGKVRLGFSYKAADFGWVYLYDSANSNSGSFVVGDRKTIGLLSGSSVSLMKNGSSESAIASTTSLGNVWKYLEYVVDIDKNSWTLYIDGESIQSYVLPDAGDGSDALSQVQAFRFQGNNDKTTDGLAYFDNITVSYEPSAAKVELVSASAKTVDDATVITAGFTGLLSENVSASDVSVVVCGGTDTVAVSDVAVLDNTLKLTLAEALTPGYEYVINPTSVKDAEGNAVSGNAYAYVPTTSYTIPGTELKTFEDLTTGLTSAKGEHPDDVNNQYALDILVKQGYYAAPGSDSANGRKITVDETKANNTQASGYAYGITGNTTFRILDVIETDIGVETYEFDYLWTTANSGMKFEPKIAGTATPIVNIGQSDNWNHMKFEYDTVNDTLSVYVNGKLRSESTNPARNVQLNEPLEFVNYIGGGTVAFAIDNYQSYVTVNPLSIESVRYTDASGKVTGANSISPETTKLDITFSEDMTGADASDITLTAGGVDVDFDTPVINGRVVTLNIPGMLPGGSQVELTIPVSVASAAGNVLSDSRIYSIETTAGKFAVSDLDIKVNGSAVTVPGNTGASGAAVSVTGYVINTAAEPQDLTVIYAFYNDDELVDVWSDDIVLTSTNYVYEISATDTTKANIDYDTVKAFVWDGLTTATPLTVAASYSQN